MILRARRPPATNSAPAPRPNSVAGSKPPVAGSALGGGAAALGAGAPALASGAAVLAPALPALASALGPAAEDCSMVCVHSPVVEGSVVIELPEKSRSSALDSYWTTPCSLATC